LSGSAGRACEERQRRSKWSRSEGLLRGKRHPRERYAHQPCVKRWTEGKNGRVSDLHFGLATLYDLVDVIASAKHRNEYPVALLLKKASAWHGEW